MGRFDFVSPGAAATESITKLLAERKAEERQRLLDQLAVQAEERANAQLAEQKRMHDATIASNQQQDELNRLSALTANMDMDADPEAMGLGSDAIELGRKYGAWQMKPQPSVSTEITGMSAEGQDLGGGQAPEFGPEQASQRVSSIPKPKFSYVGSEKQRERKRRQDQTGQIIASIMQDPAKRKAGEYLAAIAAANDGIIPDGAWDAAGVAPDVPLHMVDEPSGQLKNIGTVAPNAKVVTRGYAPRELQDRLPRPVRTNSEGYMVYMNPDGSETVGTNQMGPDPSEGPLGIPQTMREDHLLQVRMLMENPDNPDPNDLAAFRQSAFNFIDPAKTTAKVKELAAIFIMDVGKYKSALRQAIANDELDDREVSHLKQLTNLIANPQVQEILEANPYKPKVKKQPTSTGGSSRGYGPGTPPNSVVQDSTQARQLERALMKR